MWQVAQRRDVMDYEKLEEFVGLVTATVPDLLNEKQRAKLLLRLRTRSGDAEVDAEEAIFLELIQTLLKDPAEREHFFQVSLPPSYVNVRLLSLASWFCLVTKDNIYSPWNYIPPEGSFP
ncbi:unnamed protein product [Coregonus sp. 'balchen']|nr:unnamed protein product [Coregonus sp. 'balchen']